MVRLKKEEPVYIQDLLFKELGKNICYICKKSIKIDEGLNVGQGLWRHIRCKPINIKRQKNGKIR